MIPSPQTLVETFTALKRGEMAKQAVEAELARFNALAVDVPADLAERVRAYVRANPAETWGDAVRAIMDEGER